MLMEYQKYSVDKRCEKILAKSLEEAEMSGTYFTLDEVASRMKSAPLGLDNALEKLHAAGYFATSTSLNPTGFRTNCRIDEIIKIFSN